MDYGVPAFDPSGMFNPKSGLFLVSIPKNGSTFIRTSFGLTTHCTLSMTGGLGVRTAAVIRNPIDRAVSSYLEIRKRPGPMAKGRKFLRLPVNKECFSLFVDSLVSDGVFDQHASRQCDCLLLPDGSMYPFDFTILFDRFEEDVSEMARVLGVEAGTGRRNESSEMAVEIRKWAYEDAVLKGKILSFYSSDWDAYAGVLKARGIPPPCSGYV